jgi:diadenosine tetraphosphate (Ap4A) HIT family hydrolase/phosphohistidine swiveling domain-containing protein
MEGDYLRWELTGLRGQCVQAGYAVGRVRSVGDPPGAADILVAHALEPEDVPDLFDCVAAVIEQGGPTSHAAIAARELGIPMVIGVEGAVATLTRGLSAFVDTELGRILRAGTSTHCLFCDPLETPTVWEGERLRAFHEVFPVVRSHTLIVPRRHVTDPAGLDGEDWAEIGVAFTHLVGRLQETEAVSGANLALNVGPAAGQTLPHLHWHLLPRRDGDDPDPRGGVRRLLSNPLRPYPDAAGPH